MTIPSALEQGWAANNLPKELFRLEISANWDSPLQDLRDAAGNLAVDQNGKSFKDFSFLPAQIVRIPTNNEQRSHDSVRTTAFARQRSRDSVRATAFAVYINET